MRMKGHAMLYRLLADVVVVTHFGFILFVGVGGLLVWRRPRLVWLHAPAVMWAVAIVAVGVPCPLTVLENQLRRMGGEPVYRGGFVDHYIEDVIYPHRFTPLLQAVAAVVVVAGYAGWFDRRRRAREALLGAPQSSGSTR